MRKLSSNDSGMVRATETISSVAHCLRELIENSIDGGCTSINIILKGFGMDQISISDNGNGIEYSGLKMLCGEGVTSKEFGKDKSGGRGRALEAISLLSNLTIITNDGQECHKMYFVNRERIIEKTSRPKGTTVFVDNLYYNYPVRRLYALEHRKQQINEINTVCNSFALLSGVTMSVEIDGKRVLSINNLKIDLRLRSILGTTYFQFFETGSIELSKWSESAYASYFFSNHYQGSEHKIYSSVNNRPFINTSLNRSIKNEYRLCVGPKTLCLVLMIYSDRSAFDFYANSPIIGVNFINAPLLSRMIAESLNKAWKESSTSPNMDVEEKAVFLSSESSKSLKPRKLNPTIETINLTYDDIANKYSKYHAYLRNNGKSFASIDTKTFSEMEIIGQWNQAFIITRLGCDLYAIDQHAACEALNFEKLRNTKEVLVQKLIEPIIISASPEDIHNAELFKEQCKKFGYRFVIEGNNIIISGIPSGHSVASGAIDLIDLISILCDNPYASPITPTARKELAYKACRSSVMVGDTMSKKDMTNLLRDMASSDFPWNCPHGRPTWCRIWSLDTHE